MHSTTAHVSAMSPATRHSLREATMDRRVAIAVASFVLSGALITVGDFVVRWVL